MRIPVYRSQAQLSDRAPGARITARKNPAPFINAELEKGGVLTEAANQALKYSQERYKAIVEAQRNEAVFGAKEKLLQASFSFGNDDDIYNIFDGKKKYDVSVKKIFEDSLKVVGDNKYAQEDFKNAFNSFELAERFRLKGRIDEKIEARVQTSLKSLKDQQVAVLGDPYADYTLDDTIFQTAGLQNIFDKAAEKGMIPEALRANISPDVLIGAAKLALPAYGGSSLDDATQLYEAFLEIERIRVGQKDVKDMALSSEIPTHIINLLQAIPADQANQILLKTLKQAGSLYDLSQKLDDENLKTQNDLNTKAYNFALSVDLGEMVSVETMSQILNAEDFAQFKEQYPNGAIGAAIKFELQELLEDKYFWMNGAQQTALQKEVEQKTGMRKFAEVGDEVKYSRLYGTAQQGQLTTEELNRNSTSLTLSQHTQLRLLIDNESDEALNEGSRILSSRFFYDAEQAKNNDSALAQASKAAYMQANGALLEEHNRRVSIGDPMTRSQIRQFALAQHELFKDIYLEELQIEYDDFIGNWEAQNIQTNFSIDRADPLGSIEKWYGSLNSKDQVAKKTPYGAFRAQVKARFGKRGLF